MVVSFPDRFETADIAKAAKKLNVPLDVVEIDAMVDPESFLENTSLLYWRTAALTNKFPNKVGRNTFLIQADKHVKVINRMAVETPHFIYKSVQQALFQKYAASVKSIRHIETFLAEDISTLEALIAKGHLSYPIIAKPNFGTKGIGIELLSSRDDLKFFSSHNIKSYIFQNFIENKGDYRVLVFGGVVHEVMRRTPTDRSSKQYLNNISQGGRAERLAEGKTRTHLIKAGSTVAAMFNYAICGVDFIEDLDGNFYFMEINSVPEWKGLASISKYPVAEHLVKTLDAIARPLSDEELFEAVCSHFLDNLQYLSIGSQFHFLSRLYLWSGETHYLKKLEEIRDEWWSAMESIVSRITNIYAGTYVQHTPAKSYRATAYLKHPHLDVYNSFFFKCLFDQSIFNGRHFEELSASVKRGHVRDTFHRLISDPESVFTLSTPAINFIYFCARFYPEDCPPVDPATILAWGDTYSLAKSDADCDARIYFYTHAIIGASEFYSKRIPEKDRAVYVEMVRRVERTISDKYAHASIDHKAEFIVCCRLLDYVSPLEPIIFSEILASRSSRGIYFQNTLNKAKYNLARRSMHALEHSNILSLLAFMKFRTPRYPVLSKGDPIDGASTNT
jgi:glutathione synthase/RimK-type ligase-like ATP-grasp enzyme